MKKCCISLLGHVDAGKTTLSEAMLFESGQIKSLGRVDSKNAFLDTYSLEKNRGITIFSKVARMNYQNSDIILIDTPGHVDFSVEMERTLAVLDLAVLLVSAREGVKAHTKTLFKLLESYNVPTLIFINKMDMDGVSFDESLNSIQTGLSNMCLAYDIDNPDYEDIATCSEDMLNEYLESGAVAKEHIYEVISNRCFFPVLSGSALNNTGVDALLELISAYAKYLSDTTEKETVISDNDSYTSGNLKAFCYKCSHDDKGVKLSHLKILSGSLKVKGMLAGIKVNELREYNGSSFTNVAEAVNGDIICIPGDNEIKSGHYYFADAKADDTKVVLPILEPVLSYALRFPEEYDNIVMLEKARTLEEELPELKVEYDEEHKEIRLYLMGEVQTEIVTSLFMDKFSIPVSFDIGKITYKETIENTVEGVGHFEPLRHYAEVHLKLEPLPRGEGLQFDSQVSVDDLELNWQRLILTHLGERTHRGVLLGAPITDMKITVIGGRAHPKHTEGGDFRQSTYRAIRQGLMQASSRILEPYYDYTLDIPEQYVGKAMTDIDRMLGTSIVSKSEGGIATICGRAPVSTMHTYSKDVLAYSQGAGKLSLSFAGYDICHNEDEILMQNAYNPDNDLRNPSSSVFCRHGAGEIIPWDEVFDNMHIPHILDENGESTYENEEKHFANLLKTNARRNPHEERDLAMGTEEIDRIISSFAAANKKGAPTAHKGISAERQMHKSSGAASSVEAEASTAYAKKKPTPVKDKYLLIDGYNVMHADEELKQLISVNVDSARDKFIDLVDHYSAIIDDEVILVFDAYKLKNHKAEYFDFNNVHIVYTATAQTADGYIEKFSHDNSKKYDIRVATSDNAEQTIIFGHGCQVISSPAFLGLIRDKFAELRNQYNL